MEILHRTKLQNATLAQLYASANVQNIDSYPVRIQILPTYRCNYRCAMCFQSHDLHAEGAHMDWALVQALEPVMHFAAEVYLTGGEPLLYPHFESLVDQANRCNCLVSMSTNGALLKDRAAGFCLERMVMVKISIDAASPTTYAKIRKGGNFVNTVRHIAAFAEARSKRSHGPALGFGFVAMRSNIKELPRLVALAHSLGVETIRVAHMYTFGLHGDLSHESLYYHQELSDDMMSKAAAMAKKMGVSLQMPSLFNAHFQPDNASVNVYENAVCQDPWRYVQVGPLGEIFLCCGEGSEMGNMSEQGFDAVWNNPRYHRVRRMINTGNEPPECANCKLYKRSNTKEKCFVAA